MEIVDGADRTTDTSPDQCSSASSDPGTIGAALEQVVSGYPDSTAARLASNRLERLTAEGH